MDLLSLAHRRVSLRRKKKLVGSSMASLSLCLSLTLSRTITFSPALFPSLSSTLFTKSFIRISATTWNLQSSKKGQRFQNRRLISKQCDQRSSRIRSDSLSVDADVTPRRPNVADSEYKQSAASPPWERFPVTNPGFIILLRLSNRSHWASLCTGHSS